MFNFEITPDFIIGQILSAIATIITFLMFQMNSKKLILILQTVGIVFLCASYFFLDATTGLMLNAVAITRNAFYYFQTTGTKANKITSYIFAVIMAGIGFFSWEAWYSLLLIIALAVHTVYLSKGNAQLLRKSILFTSTLATVYNAFVLSIGGFIFETFSIVASIVGIIRYNKAQKNK